MTPETAELLDRIAKLKAKAEGTANPHEAEVFAAKVAELLAKHNLDEAMLRARDASREQGPIGRHPFKQRVPDKWREDIVMGVARLYFCKIVFYSDAKNRPDPRGYVFVGREHNAVVATAMAEYLIATVKRMAREFSAAKVAQTNFRKGASSKLYRRLWDLAEAQRGPAGEGSGTALVVRTEDQAIAEYLGEVPTAKARKHKFGAGAYEGWEAADKISLNAQIKETRTERMLT